MAGLTGMTPGSLRWADLVMTSGSGLDPHIITAFASFQIVNGTIYEGLTAIDKAMFDRVGGARKLREEYDQRSSAKREAADSARTIHQFFMRVA